MITQATKEDERVIYDAIKTASINDADAFFTNVDDDDEVDEHLVTLSHYFNQECESAFFILKTDGVVEVMASIDVPVDRRLKHVATLGWVWVACHRRGLGLGSAIIDKALKYAESLKTVEKIQLSVLSRQTKAIDIYRRLSFQPVVTLKHNVKVEGGYQDTIVMEKVIRPRPEL